MSFYNEFCEENEGYYSKDKRRKEIIIYECNKISLLPDIENNENDSKINDILHTKFNDYCNIRINLFLNQIKPLLDNYSNNYKSNLFNKFKFTRNEIGYLPNNCMRYHGSGNNENTIDGFFNIMSHYNSNNSNNNELLQKYYILYNGIFVIFSHLWLVAMNAQEQSTIWHGFDTFWYDKCKKLIKNVNEDVNNIKQEFKDSLIEYLLNHIAQTIIFGDFFLDFNKHSSKKIIEKLKKKYLITKMIQI